jgi:hypothetical protein
MHAEPSPLFHRDIRWPNVIRNAATRTQWFLIDWDDASTYPTIAAMHLDPKSHPPMVFMNNHGAEVDIWAAGKLIIDAVVFSSDISVAVVAVGERMVKGEIVTVAQALDELAGP